ncbi:MAG: outer membrane protein assembly factor BamD [Betaproteobacteria bacterium RIFCSPLOWO2_02_FULL_65_20]|nr:MAG: outer membrane protein assembly factor BamD [Betaproteobacteria bacterium RIFCSPLOWO2_02_FULL_65_20]
MKRNLSRLATIAALLPLLLLSACGLFPDKGDPTRDWSAARLYKEAKDELNSGSYEQAIKYYESLEARFPYGAYSQQAQIESAYAYFKQGEAASAIAAIDRFLKLHPSHSSTDYAYYLKGLVHFNEDMGLFGKFSGQDLTERDPKAARDSFDAFKELARRFPDSKYTPDAVARMKYLVNALASSEVHVARWYMRRGAYIAAANRAQYALRYYPEAPAIEEALFVMVKAYDALGMNQLRDDAERVMRRNFPKSAYLTGAAAASGPWWKLW